MSNIYSVKEYEIFSDSLVEFGSYGRIYDCKHKTKYQDQQLCVQVISNRCYDEVVVREMEILEKLNVFQNNHIINIYDIFEFEGRILIFMQKYNDDLYIQLNKRKKQNNYYTTTEILDFIYQFVDGYQLLIQNNIIHSYIQTRNIFVDKNIYKIGGFTACDIVEDVKVKGMYAEKIGMYESRKLNDKSAIPYYQSPQIIMKEPFSYKMNIYSFGMILYQMCYLTFPFDSIPNLRNFITKLRENKFKVVDLPIKGSQEEINEITNIIEQTLVYEEEQRLDWQDLINSIKNKKIYDKFKQRHQSQSIIIDLQQNSIIKFQSLMEKSPLSQIIRLQVAKFQLIQQFYTFFNFSLMKAFIKIRDLDFQLILSSIFGYEYSIIKQIKAIHSENMEEVSLYIRNKEQIFEQDKIYVQETQILKQYNDQLLFEEIKTPEKQLIEEKYRNQVILQTIQAINNLKIRRQEQVKLRDLLENKTIDCEQFSQLTSYFLKIYLEQQIIDVLLRYEPQQIPQGIRKFIIYYYEILDLEKNYSQTEFQKEAKELTVPKLEWSEEDIQLKLSQLRNDIVQKNQNQQKSQ